MTPLRKAQCIECTDLLCRKLKLALQFSKWDFKLKVGSSLETELRVQDPVSSSALFVAGTTHWGSSTSLERIASLGNLSATCISWEPSCLRDLQPASLGNLPALRAGAFAAWSISWDPSASSLEHLLGTFLCGIFPL